MTRAPLLLSTTLLLACSSSGATATVDATIEDTSADDTNVADSVVEGGSDAGLDTTVADTAKDDTTPVDGGPPPDTFRPDLGLDAAGTFECGTERCGATFQFCQIDTAPGTGRHCVALPVSCFAFPSCPCVTTKTCGSEAKGTCTDVSGAITVQCK